jgi:(1->4)-alpha-D-glucan 1-alpha-D-glucosylmutase
MIDRRALRAPRHARSADTAGIPRATMRMQFHAGFPFDAATALVPYLAALGVSHLYASPILKARPGSTHGYDCVDVHTVNPELGGELALRRLADALHAAGLGLVVDIVPNHMGVGNDNAWWQDVLLWGEASRHASTFDIDWGSSDPLLRGKVLAPWLGTGYGEVLGSGALVLAFDATRAAFEVRYFDNRFPIAIADYEEIFGAAENEAFDAIAETFARVAAFDPPRNDGHARAALLDERDAALRDARAALAKLLNDASARAAIEGAIATYDANDDSGRARLHALLDRQSYRLSSWRAAADEINWRRFFEVTDLAGLRVEREDVFDEVHATLFRLYREGVIDALRVDHVDGLAEPRAYCRELRRRLEALSRERPPSARTRPYLVVEKILASGEDLRADWKVDGTSGYDFMDEVGSLLHDAAGAEPLANAWARATSRPADFRGEALAARRQILAENLPAEFNAAARALHRVARADIDTRDIGFVAIQRALTELLVQIDVYRTYVDARGRDADDTEVVIRALRAAHATVRPSDRPVLAWLDHWLGGDAASDVLPETLTRRRIAERRQAITRFQQLTPPLAAKSVEDTAFYRYGRLISRNEVGSNPDEFALSIDAFHAKCRRRAERFPHAMLAIATHDHKRGADTRARLAVLSEMPARWTSLVDRWLVLNTPVDAQPAVASDVAAETTPMVPPAGLAAIAHSVAETAPAPLPEDQIMLMQTLIGAWPFAPARSDIEAVAKSELDAFVERVAAWQVKALRETKRPSDWSMPNDHYEATCRAYLDRIMDPARSPFAREAAAFVDAIGVAGALNGLVQATLHLTVPGMPDLYQGADYWDLSLVDPDNRRPVDYAAREASLADRGDVASLMTRWRDGRIKQSIIASLLALRRASPSLFAHGAYHPLSVDGPMQDHVLAFMRVDGRERVIVAATLKAASLVEGRDEPRVDDAAWGDTTVQVPVGLGWHDVLSGQPIKASGRRLPIARLFASLPVAVLRQA